MGRKRQGKKKEKRGTGKKKGQEKKRVYSNLSRLCALENVLFLTSFSRRCPQFALEPHFFFPSVALRLAPSHAPWRPSPGDFFIFIFWSIRRLSYHFDNADSYTTKNKSRALFSSVQPAGIPNPRKKNSSNSSSKNCSAGHRTRTEKKSRCCWHGIKMSMNRRVPQ